MPGVAAHPRVEIRGDKPNLSLVLTDPEGNDFMETTESYATYAEAQVAARLLEDSARYALPLPTPYDQSDEE